MAKKDTLRPTNDGVVRDAKTLLRTARFGALAVLDPANGGPLVSRVAVACDCDGAPLILVSGLSAHTSALMADPRCSLLVGEPGKGDALAHPRLSVRCQAELIDTATATPGTATRFLAHVPKAALYAALPDFRYFRLQPESASLIGGFGRAYQLDGDDLLTPDGFNLADAEAAILDHMNADHADAVCLYAQHLAKQPAADWKLTGIDPEGIDLAAGDQLVRLWFDKRVDNRSDARAMLVALVEKARAQPLGTAGS